MPARPIVLVPYQKSVRRRSRDRNSTPPSEEPDARPRPSRSTGRLSPFHPRTTRPNGLRPVPEILPAAPGAPQSCSRSAQIMRGGTSIQIGAPQSGSRSAQSNPAPDRRNPAPDRSSQSNLSPNFLPPPSPAGGQRSPSSKRPIPQGTLAAAAVVGGSTERYRSRSCGKVALWATLLGRRGGKDRPGDRDGCSRR